LQVGDSKAALAAAEEAHDLFRRLLDAEDGAPEEETHGWQGGLGDSLERRGKVLLKQGRTLDAVAALNEALAIRRGLASALSEGQGQRDLIDSLSALGDAHMQQGDWPRADERYREALRQCEQLSRDNPGDRSLRSRLASTCEKMGNLRVEPSLNDLRD